MLGQEDLLPKLLAALPVSMIVYDAAQRVVAITESVFRWHGLPRDALFPGMTLEKVVSVLAWNGVYGPGDPSQIIRQIMAVDRSRAMSRLVRARDGRVVLLENRPLPDGGFLSCATDVSTLSRAEAEASGRARLLETVVARLHAGVAAFDSDLRLSVSNPPFEGLTSLPAGSLRPGMTHAEIMQLLQDRGELTEAEAAETRARVAEGHFQYRTRQRTRPNGDVLQVGSQPLPHGGFLLELDDITALKHAEDDASYRAALLDGVLEALPHGVCVFGPDRRVWSCSTAPITGS